MANIRENKKNGKVISFRFTVCLERDVRGKQIRKYTTWTAPADLTPAKARKAAGWFCVVCEWYVVRFADTRREWQAEHHSVLQEHDTHYLGVFQGFCLAGNQPCWYSKISCLSAHRVQEQIGEVAFGKNITSSVRDAQPDIWLKVVRGKRKTKCGSHDFQWPKTAKRFDHFWRVSLKCPLNNCLHNAIIQFYASIKTVG